MAGLLFSTTFTVRMHDIDAAGVMFFGRFFYYIHDAYEDFLKQHSLSIQQLLDSAVLLPISHTEADFKAPIVLHEEIIIEMYLQEIKEQEFVLHYLLLGLSGETKATALSSHICLDGDSRQRTALPAEIHSVLIKR